MKENQRENRLISGVIADLAGSLVEVGSRDRNLHVLTLFSQRLVSDIRLRRLKAIWLGDGPKLSSL